MDTDLKSVPFTVKAVFCGQDIRRSPRASKRVARIAAPSDKAPKVHRIAQFFRPRAASAKNRWRGRASRADLPAMDALRELKKLMARQLPAGGGHWRNDALGLML